jgi:hypothetical protein
VQILPYVKFAATPYAHDVLVFVIMRGQIIPVRAHMGLLNSDTIAQTVLQIIFKRRFLEIFKILIVTPFQCWTCS